MSTVPIQNLRSGTSNKRPTASNLADGQIAINYHEDDPGIYLKSDQGDLVKVSPTFIGSSQPNLSPATGGSSGNSKGETWLDTTNSSAPVLKIYNGSAWVSDFGYNDIDVSGSYTQTIQNLSNEDDIDCSLGNYFTFSVSTNTSFTFSNAPSSRVYSCVVKINHTSGTISWPTSVKFAGDTAPTLTTGKFHLFLFVTDDAGTTFRAGTLTNFTA